MLNNVVWREFESVTNPLHDAIEDFERKEGSVVVDHYSIGSINLQIQTHRYI